MTSQIELWELSVITVSGTHFLLDGGAYKC